MGGIIDKKEWEKMEKSRESAGLARLKSIEAAAREFIYNPTNKNKERLKEVLSLRGERSRKSSFGTEIKIPFADW